MTLIVLGALLAINVIAFLTFGWDKLCAVRNWWRVPEANLLLLALLGGAIGAIVGQQVFRHKTRKEPFRSSLYLMCGVNVVAFTVLAVPEFRGVIWNLIEAIT